MKEHTQEFIILIVEFDLLYSVNHISNVSELITVEWCGIYEVLLEFDALYLDISR